ncbi:MAG: ABC transporter permease [Vicinamibacterales bacterium]
MRSEAGWRRYVRSRISHLPVDAGRETEIVEELASQLSATYERELAGGATEAAARAAADAEVPDWPALADTLTRIERPYVEPAAAGAGTGGFMTGLVQDVRYALRALARAPGFTAVAVLTLALGISAATIVYAMVDGILLRPLPIHQPDRVVLTRELVNGDELSVSWPNFLDWRDRATSFEQLAAWRGVTTNLSGIGEPQRLMARQVTANLFGVLGVAPILGRDLTAADDQPGVERVCLVSYGFWQRQLGADPGAIGRRLLLDEVPTTIVGVLPESFTVARVEDVFLPYGNFLAPGSFMLGRGNHFGLAGIGRLKPGVSVSEANAEIAGLARQLELEHPATNSGNGGIVRPLHDVLVGPARPMLLVLLGAVAVMLLIACANLANLLLARAASRAQEIAVRRSLGAGRSRIVRQLLTESTLLALAGGAAGIGLAFAGFAAVVALLPADQPRVHTLAIDLRVLTMSALVTLGTGILFGLAPALHAASGRAMELLRGARVTGAAQGGALTRRALLLVEVALAVMLVAGAGLMLRTMSNLLAVDTGFDAARVISAQFSLPNRFDRQKRLAFFDQAIERLRSLPGVAGAAYTNSLPVEGSNWNSIFIIEGQTVPPRSELPSAAMTQVSAGYFDALGITLFAGRGFTTLDVAGTQEVVVVNRAFARRFFGDGSPIGTRIKQGWPEGQAPWREIVGVVNDVAVAGLDGDPRLQIYLPAAQSSANYGSFVIRAHGDPLGLGRDVEAAIHAVEPTLPIYNVRTMAEVIGIGIGNRRLSMVMLSGFAAMALLMASIGVFGVTAYTVSQRTHEIGVRMALGAQPSSVLTLVLRQEVAACVAGVAVGMGGAVLLSSLIESLLFGVAARDVLSLSAAAAALLVVTAVACYIPARRATQVNPVTALRLE